jgi:hypothetical protein
MATVVDEESEQQRMETEAKAKKAADAAAREPLPPPPPFLTQQDFAQYMRMADKRQRMLIECHSKMMQDVMDRNCEGWNERVHGVSLADFLNTRPLPFASALWGPWLTTRDSHYAYSSRSQEDRREST